MTSTAAADLRIFNEFNSPHAQLVLFVLAAKHIPHELVSMSYSSKPAELSAVNPFASVPTLVTPTFSLYESRAIARYLDHRFPSPPHLLPLGLEPLALVDQWCSVEAKRFAPEAWSIVNERLWMPVFAGVPGDEAKVARALAALLPVMDVLEAALKGTGWLVGEGMTMADAGFLPLLALLAGVKEGGEAFEGRPAVKAWYEAMADTEAWKAVKAQVDNSNAQTQKAKAAAEEESRKKQKTENGTNS